MQLGPFVVALAFLSPAIARAGLCSDAIPEPRQDFQLIAGFSPASPTLIGTAPDRHLALAGLSYGYRCWVLSSVSVSYTAALLPAAILIQPAETRYSLFPPSVRRIDSHAVYGFAIAPLGFTFEFARKRRLHPFAETLGGIIASSEPIPENGLNATGLNFLFDFGGGLRWNAGPRRALSLGYRFLHISNAGTTSFNPGVDNNVIYVGYSFLR